MGCCRHRGRWIVATMTLPTVALALVSLVELGPIGSASHCQKHAESLHQLRLQPHSPEQMPLRRRDECLGSHDNKSIAGAGLESYLLYSIMRQLLMQSRLL